MWRIFKFLFTGSWHEHTWETIKEGKIVNDYDEYIGTYHNLRCTKCGNLKKVDLI